jgi:single-strand DNA-binding protein
MANDLNQCTFTGRLGADPETRSFQNGGRVCNFRIAVGESWKDKASGERKERTEWVSVTIHSDGLVGVASEYLRKGSRVLVQGKMQTRKWQDKDGTDRYSTEVVLQGFDAKLIMLDGKQDGEGGRGNARGGGGQRAGNQSGGDGSRGHAGGFGGGWDDDLDDDLPFISDRSVW